MKKNKILVTFLIIFVIIKFIITSRDQWYENVNNYKWLKYIYNLSTDLIAASLAFISLKKKDWLLTNHQYSMVGIFLP